MMDRTYTIKGIAGLLLHNARLSDPIGEHAKALRKVTSKRKKTDDDHEEIARIEYLGSFYPSATDDIILPGGNIERMILDAGKTLKLGTTVKKALIVPGESSIEYKGPRDPEKLWATGRFSLRSSVKVGTSRTMRTRPFFPEWQLTFTVVFDETVLDPAQVDDMVEIAGKFVGLADWRPKYGRFTVEHVE